MAEAAVEPALDEDPPEEDARAGSSVTGMSGLSDLMQAEPNAKAGDTAVAGHPPPIREAQFASAEAAKTLAQSAANLRQTSKPAAMSPQTRRMAILVIALLALGVALAGIGLVVLGGDDGNMNTTRSANSPASPADQSASPEDLLPDPAGPPAKPAINEPGASNDQRVAPNTRADDAPAVAIIRPEINPPPLNQGGAG